MLLERLRPWDFAPTPHQLSFVKVGQRTLYRLRRPSSLSRLYEIYRKPYFRLHKLRTHQETLVSGKNSLPRFLIRKRAEFETESQGF